MKWPILLIASAAFVRTAAGQTPAEFEVATIKPAPPQEFGHVSTHMNWDGHRLDFANVNLKEMMARAYHVQQYQIMGPDFLETERFDVVAKFPDGSKGDQMPLMLQALLADRFKLAIHRQTKELPVYDLVVAKGGPKLKAAESESGTSKNSNGTRAHVVVNASMRRFAEFLSQEVNRPVVDKTNLTGSYEMTLDYTVDDSAAGNDAATGPSIFTALQEQLGLKLESAKGPVETIVVDHVERTPTEN